ncbi:MAG: hypothetical protein LUO80_10660 [Methylococcaceae bacterium]|nr:hypothetical protein [Methylococcaceae bacterium]
MVSTTEARAGGRRGLLALVLVLPVWSLQAAEFYRYYGDDGRVNISQALPSAYATRGYEVIDETGRVIRKVAAQKTPEQLARDAEVAARHAEELAAAAQRRDYDNLLLLRYSSVEDIEIARDRFLHESEARLTILETSLRDLKRQVEAQQEQAAEFERKNQQVPPKLEKVIADLLVEVAAVQDRIEATRQEKERAAESFRRDRARFEELKVESIAR